MASTLALTLSHFMFAFVTELDPLVPLSAVGHGVLDLCQRHFARSGAGGGGEQAGHGVRAHYGVAEWRIGALIRGYDYYLVAVFFVDLERVDMLFGVWLWLQRDEKLRMP